MSSVILYYTFTGSTRAEAERLAAETGAALCPVQELKKRTLFSAYVTGCMQAMRQRAAAIQPISIDLRQFDEIILGCPIWAGCPAPAFHAMLALLPAGKRVSLFFCSGSGNSSKSAAQTKALVQARGCTLASYRDVKAVPLARART